VEDDEDEPEVAMETEPSHPPIGELFFLDKGQASTSEVCSTSLPIP